MAPSLSLRQFCGMPEREGMVSFLKASREDRAQWNWRHTHLEALLRQQREQLCPRVTTHMIHPFFPLWTGGWGFRVESPAKAQAVSTILCGVAANSGSCWC